MLSYGIKGLLVIPITQGKGIDSYGLDCLFIDRVSNMEMGSYFVSFLLARDVRKRPVDRKVSLVRVS